MTMRVFKTKILLTALLVLTTISAFCEEKVTFEVRTPMMVGVGETFRVEFVLNASPDRGSFTAPEFSGFDVLAGPAISESTSVQIVNSSMTKTKNHTTTYVLAAQEGGNFTIGSAEISVDDVVYRTQKLPIEVVAEEISEQSQNQNQGTTQQSSSRSKPQGKLGADDILLRITASQKSVYKGEPLRVAIKIYQRAINGIQVESIKYPSFNGFWSQELDANSQGRSRETYNGKIYEVSTIREYLLYPQQSGTLTIDPMEMAVLAQIVVPGSRNSNMFFGGGPEVLNIKKKIVAPKVTINVKQLPLGAPASFSGAVGSFDIETTLPNDHLAANSAATYAIKISGTGNLTFIQAPKLDLPTSFEQYNVKTTESIRSSRTGTSGYRNFEYPFIARAEGNYDIPSVEFTYFNPNTNQYTTLSSKEMVVNIAPDATASRGENYTTSGNGMSKEDVKMLGKDIRFIKLDDPNLRVTSAPFIFSRGYTSILTLIIITFIVAYTALRKRIKESKNSVLLRGKRANKVAIQRFRVAKNYMAEHNRPAFFEEMLRALWGYMSDKFNIPVANLTKDSVRDELHKRGVSAEDLQRFSTIITNCDEAQYSPVETTQMNDTYKDSINLISCIESIIKR